MDWENRPPFNIDSYSSLEEAFQRHCSPQLTLIRFEAVLSRPRLHDIFCAWKEDLDRSEKGNFLNKAISPDHIKAAAHLTYWIRREAPIIDLITLQDDCSKQIIGGQYDDNETIKIELGTEEIIPDSIEIQETELKSWTLNTGLSLIDFQEARTKAVVYGNELFGFSFGFYLAKAYEEQKRREVGIASKGIAWPSGAYIDDLCYFLKFKNVSPHSLDLIYRALLQVPEKS